MWAALSFHWTVLGNNVIPTRVLAFASDSNKGSVLGLVTVVGALVSMLTGPIAGVLSDESRLRWGRRRRSPRHNDVGFRAAACYDPRRMQPRHAYWLPAGLLLAAWLALSAPPLAAWRVSCDAVMSEVHKETRTAEETHVDISKVAVRLHTSVAWTENCMRAYGMRTKRPGVESAEGREQEFESFEEDEPEEAGPEDTEEEGAPNPKVHPERQRLLKVHPPPTPRPGTESIEGFREGFETR
jgi:hypothetical protein